MTQTNTCTSSTNPQTELELKVAVLVTEAYHCGVENRMSVELEKRQHNLLSFVETLIEENGRLKELLENRNDTY
jgi:hypothetical protein